MNIPPYEQCEVRLYGGRYNSRGDAIDGYYHFSMKDKQWSRFAVVRVRRPMEPYGYIAEVYDKDGEKSFGQMKIQRYKAKEAYEALVKLTDKDK